MNVQLSKAEDEHAELKQKLRQREAQVKLLENEHKQLRVSDSRLHARACTTFRLHSCLLCVCIQFTLSLIHI